MISVFVFSSSRHHSPQRDLRFSFSLFLSIDHPKKYNALRVIIQAPFVVCFGFVVFSCVRRDGITREGEQGSKSRKLEGKKPHCLNEKLLNIGLDGLNLTGKLVAGEDGECNHVAGDSSGTAECGLAGDKDVRHILVFAEQGKVEQNLDGVGVASDDDEVSNTAVQGLSGLVGSLLDELGIRGFLDNVQNGLGQAGLGEREGLVAHFGGHCDAVVSL